MLALATAVAAVTTGFVQPPVVMGGSAIAPARQMPPIMSAEAPSGRRAAIGAGAAAAAALMMPGLANAEVSQARMDELMAEERAKAAEKATAVQDDEKKSKVLVTAISGIVLVSPIFGIMTAQRAIKDMVGDDEDFKNEFRSNDPTVQFQRRRGNRR